MSNVPHLKSDDDTPTPSVHRLPPNPYILAKLNQHRAQVLDASRAKPGSTHFSKPPPTLERCAELGDDIIQTGANDTI